MLHIETQSQFVDVTAAMMRSCFTATANTWAALACHGLSFWASMLGAGSRGASRPLDWTAWRRCRHATTGSMRRRSRGQHRRRRRVSPATGPMGAML